MNFLQYKPAGSLTSYIDAYWEMSGGFPRGGMDKITPDGCLDLLVNLGDDLYIDSTGTVLKNGKAYLGGAITRALTAKTSPETRMQGVRFKPAGFLCLYLFSSLHETTDHFIELDRTFIPEVKVLTANAITAWNSYFSDKPVRSGGRVLRIADYIQQQKGNTSVEAVAKAHFITVRQLERDFKYAIGLTPKKFINIIRYKSACHMIHGAHPARSLLDIALECGYYDHAHLSKEIKKYGGTCPAEI